MYSRIYFITMMVLLALSGGVFAQDDSNKDAAPETPKETKVNLTEEQAKGIQIAESTLIVYSGLRGRVGLGQVRKTTVEIGKTTYFDADGSKRNADYVCRIIRGESFGEEKIRLDQKFPNADYAMIFDGGKVFGVIANTVFDPRDDAEKDFVNRIVRGIDGLLRYKENESEVVLVEDTKVMGVDLFVVRLTDKDGRETDYYISKKSLRVMMIKYEEDGVEFQRKFYDHNYAQGTLVPYRTVLKADGKNVEETSILTITFGQVVEESFFQFGAA